MTFNIQTISSRCQQTTKEIDRKLEGQSPTVIIAGTLAAAFATKWLWDHKPRFLNKNWEDLAVAALQWIPPVRDMLEKEDTEFTTGLEKKFFKGVHPEEIQTRLPERGLSREVILERIKKASGTVYSGKNTGAIYNDDEELDKLIHDVDWVARRTNPLHTSITPLLRQLEAEICAMVASMYHGDENVCGNVTYGGTDSILHAVLTAKERAKTLGITKGWEIVIPETAHPAFRKAAHYFEIKLREAPVYPEGHEKAFEVKVDAMRKLVNRNTVLVVGSCPGYPHGIIDPIEEISDMLEKVDSSGTVGLHVDACLGGFIIPFMEKAGYGDRLTTRFGFDVARVTSLSADTHKYGFGAKGNSVVLFRNQEWKKNQIFVDQYWQGGIYATPTTAGSRPGQTIAGVWSVLNWFGEDRYVEEAKKIVELNDKIVNALQASAPFKVLGKPKAMVTAFTFRDPQLNIHDLNEQMSKKGWYLAGLQRPNALHICVTAVHTKNPNFTTNFIRDLLISAKEVRALPQKGKSSGAVMYRTNATIGYSIFVKEFARKFWEIAGRTHPQLISLAEAGEADDDAGESVSESGSAASSSSSSSSGEE